MRTNKYISEMAQIYSVKLGNRTYKIIDQPKIKPEVKQAADSVFLFVNNLTFYKHRSL